MQFVVKTGESGGGMYSVGILLVIHMVVRLGNVDSPCTKISGVAEGVPLSYSDHGIARLPFYIQFSF